MAGALKRDSMEGKAFLATTARPTHVTYIITLSFEAFGLGFD